MKQETAWIIVIIVLSIAFSITCISVNTITAHRDIEITRLKNQ